MIQIDNTIVSLDLFTERFACDLQACRGICCVEGNAGAPLDSHEEALLEQEYSNYAPFMTPQGIEAVRQQGVAVLDFEGDLTTPLVNDAECAYTITENGVTWCAIEKAWSQGKTPFRKPISCHLYPIRLVKLSNGMTGLQYHRWDVCRCNAAQAQPIFRTLREPIVRRFGQAYYDALEEAETELQDYFAAR